MIYKKEYISENEEHLDSSDILKRCVELTLTKELTSEGCSVYLIKLRDEVEMIDKLYQLNSIELMMLNRVQNVKLYEAGDLLWCNRESLYTQLEQPSLDNVHIGDFNSLRAELKSQGVCVSRLDEGKDKFNAIFDIVNNCIVFPNHEDAEKIVCAIEKPDTLIKVSEGYTNVDLHVVGTHNRSSYLGLMVKSVEVEYSNTDEFNEQTSTDEEKLDLDIDIKISELENLTSSLDRIMKGRYTYSFNRAINRALAELEGQGGFTESVYFCIEELNTAYVSKHSSKFVVSMSVVELITLIKNNINSLWFQQVANLEELSSEKLEIEECELIVTPINETIMLEEFNNEFSEPISYKMNITHSPFKTLITYGLNSLVIDNHILNNKDSEQIINMFDIGKVSFISDVKYTLKKLTKENEIIESTVILETTVVGELINNVVNLSRDKERNNINSVYVLLIQNGLGEYIFKKPINSYFVDL